MKVAVCSILSGALVFACVIADPPGDLPQLPERRPTIVRGSVFPPPSVVLGSWPDKFIVPVELADPRREVLLSAFVDYNPATGDGIKGSGIAYPFEPKTTQGNIRTLEVLLNPPSSDRCHVIEIVVALRFKAVTDPKNAHTPDTPGGDSVSWFFSPSGDLAGCPVIDAGLTPIDLDAGPDGAEEAGIP